MSIIGGFLRVPPKLIQFAGTKDKRAHTVQRVSIKHRDPNKLAQFSRPTVRIGNFSFEKDPLHLGDLSGNHFQLVMRGISPAEMETVKKAAQRFTSGGFINYFGLQRFGTTEVSTMDVGKALLKSEWDKAVELIMRPRSFDNEALAKCRQIWKETHEADKALRPLGRRRCIEADLLQGLLRNHERDPFNAIQKIARNSRLIYVHSYQRYQNWHERHSQLFWHPPFLTKTKDWFNYSKTFTVRVESFFGPFLSRLKERKKVNFWKEPQRRPQTMTNFPSTQNCHSLLAFSPFWEQGRIAGG